MCRQLLIFPPQTPNLVRISKPFRFDEVQVKPDMRDGDEMSVQMDGARQPPKCGALLDLLDLGTYLLILMSCFQRYRQVHERLRALSDHCTTETIVRRRVHATPFLLRTAAGVSMTMFPRQSKTPTISLFLLWSRRDMIRYQRFRSSTLTFKGH